MTDYLIDHEIQNTTYDMTGVFDTLLVTNSGSLIASNQPLVQALIASTGESQLITIDGLVSAGADAIDAVDVEGNNTSVFVNGAVQGGVERADAPLMLSSAPRSRLVSAPKLLFVKQQSPVRSASAPSLNSTSAGNALPPKASAPVALVSSSKLNQISYQWEMSEQGTWSFQ
jgi:hypothetical protein